MNLRSGTPLWNASRIGTETSWGSALETEVLIVGMGVSGALIAHRLLAENRSFAMIDFRPPAGGSTRASTAIVQYELDMPLHKLSEDIGRANAEKIYRETFGAIIDLDRIAQSLSTTEIGWRRCPSLQLGYSEDEQDALRREYEARSSAGFSMKWLAAESLRRNYPFQAQAAIYNRDTATLNPVALTEALLHEVQRKGVKLCGESRLEAFEQETNGLRIDVEGGREIRCRKMILAGGYETKKLLKLSCGRLTSSYAGATASGTISEPWPESAAIWEVSSPYYYLRSTEDGRLLIGGQDKPFRNEILRDLLIPIEHFGLERKMREMTGMKNLSFECFWTGTFAESDDGLPFIGPLPENENIYVVLGCGGNGITFATLAREMAVAWLDAKTHALDELFSLSRSEQKEKMEKTSRQDAQASA